MTWISYWCNDPLHTLSTCFTDGSWLSMSSCCVQWAVTWCSGDRGAGIMLHKAIEASWMSTWCSMMKPGEAILCNHWNTGMQTRLLLQWIFTVRKHSLSIMFGFIPVSSIQWRHAIPPYLDAWKYIQNSIVNSWLATAEPCVVEFALHCQWLSTLHPFWAETGDSPDGHQQLLRVWAPLHHGHLQWDTTTGSYSWGGFM